MKRNREAWVIDASVSAKWYLADEDWTNEAAVFRDRYERDEILATAPRISQFEVANAVSVAAWAGRISPEVAHELIRLYTASGLPLGRDPDWLAERAAEISIRFRVPVYDAAYVALAQSLGGDLITADRRLHDAVSPEFPFVHWLGSIALL